MSRSKRIVRRFPRPAGYRPMLAIEADAKTIKGEKFQVLTGIMYLAPANLSGYNVCTFAGLCKDPCLNTSGHGQFDACQNARVAKTRFLFEQRETAIASLRYDIESVVIRAKNRSRKTHKSWRPAVRINGTSDLAWLALLMAECFPDVQFYDYTKLPFPERRIRSNYWLTFSHDGNDANVAECRRVLALGINVSVVFGVAKGDPLPETWNGYRVIDGDLTDIRFRDPKGVVVGVRAKGRAKKTYSAFVVRDPQATRDPLIQISLAA